MQDAVAEFTGTSEEAAIIVANANLAVKRGEVDVAVSMLKSAHLFRFVTLFKN